VETRSVRYRRTTDRIEDVTSWLLLTAGIALIALSCAFGLGTSSALAERARTEAQDRAPGVARLHAASTPTAGDLAARSPVMVAASWRDQQGVEHTGLVSAPAQQQAGSTVPIWVDRTGAVVTAPLSSTDVLVCSVIAALVAFGFGAGTLTLIWLLVRRATLAHNYAQWEREWRAVAPIWSKGEERRG
jgi:hypothetical protein